MQAFLLEKGSEPRTGICCRSSPLRNANRNVYGMAFCTFAHGCAFHGLQNIQSSINMDAGLGLVSLAVLDFGYMASAIFTVGMVNSIGTKYSLIVGLVGYLIYVVLCYYPSWYTLIPGGLVAGLTTGPIWIAASCHVIAIVEKMAPVLKERHDVLVGRYIGIIYLAYQLAAIPGNLASSLIFHFSEKYGNSSHDNGTTVDCDLLSTFGVERIYIYILVSFYVFVQVLSILAAFLFLTDASSNPETRLGKVKALVTASTIKKVFNKKMLILAPVGIYNGLQLSISSGIFAQANFGVKVEASSVLTPDLSRSHPADALVNNWTGGNPAPLSIPIALLHLVQEPLRQRVPNWILSKPAAIDLLVTSPLNPTILLEARVTTGVASWMTEQRKHCSSDGKCSGVYLLASFLISHMFFQGKVSGAYAIASLSRSIYHCDVVLA
eukprot:Em0015g595a